MTRKELQKRTNFLKKAISEYRSNNGYFILLSFLDDVGIFAIILTIKDGHITKAAKKMQSYFNVEYKSALEIIKQYRENQNDNL